MPPLSSSDAAVVRRARRARCAGLLALLLAAVALTAAAADYQSLDIVSPNDDAVIHDNSGRFDVDTMLIPPLRVDDGDRFVFIIDGAPMPPMRDGFLALDQLQRGSHTLQVQVVDAAGNALITSAPRTVELWQASQLAPGPSQSPMQPQIQPRLIPAGPSMRPPGL